MHTRHQSPWVPGIAALLTVSVMLAGALWFAFRPDDGEAPSAAGSAEGVAPTSSSTPSPSETREKAAARREQTARLAADAAEGGRASSDGAATGPTRAAVEPRDDVGIAAARAWLETALTWREDEASLGPWGRAVERANDEWAVDDVEQVIVPATALEHISSEASIHAALPSVVEISDRTNPEWDSPNVVTLEAAVVFGTGEGWTRPGLRLLVTFEVADGQVTSVFIDGGYVVSDPELVP